MDVCQHSQTAEKESRVAGETKEEAKLPPLLFIRREQKYRHVHITPRVTKIRFLLV